MGQINVNPHTVREGGSDRTAAAGINLITVLIVLAVLAVVVWFLLTGPLQGLIGGGTTNINVNVPTQPQPTVNVNPPAQPASKP